MRTSQTVHAKIQIMLDKLNTLPDVSAERTDDRSGLLHISGHAPLNKIHVQYTCRNRFWSQNYDITYTCLLSSAFPASGAIHYNTSQNRFAVKSLALIEACNALNNNPFLAKLLNSIDLYDFHMNFQKGNISAHITPVTGSITKLMIPPVTHLILPTEEECIKILQILQLTAAAI